MPGLDAGVAADEEAEQAPHPGLFGEKAMVSGGFFSLHAVIVSSGESIRSFFLE